MATKTPIARATTVSHELVAGLSYEDCCRDDPDRANRVRDDFEVGTFDVEAFLAAAAQESQRDQIDHEADGSDDRASRPVDFDFWSFDRPIRRTASMVTYAAAPSMSKTVSPDAKTSAR